jgi:putative aldouronate transport system substrate-binding protein
MGGILMKTKLLTLLCIAMLTSSLAGCKPKEKPVTVKDEPSKPKPELRFLGPYDRFDFATDHAAKVLAEKTGYTVKYESLPAENADEKLNLMMSNKEAFDFMKVSPAQFQKLAQEGALEPLDEILDKYGKTLKSVIAQTSWESAKINGKIYGIPEKNAMDSIGTGIVVRQDWLDELGLKAPKTLDEFYEVLKAIKDKKKVIPLTGNDAVMTEISGAFGISASWVVKGGQIVNRVDDPAMKDYLAYMNKLYKEGLIDSEWPINNGNKNIEKFTSGKAAMFKMGWWTAPAVIPALQKNFQGANMGLLPPLKGKDGKQAALYSAGISNYAVIPKSAKNKEDAMKFMDLKVTPEIFKAFTIGEEGVHFKKEGEKYFPILPKFFDEKNNAHWYLTGTDQKAYEVYWQARVRKDKDLQSYFERMQEDAKNCGVIDALAFAPPITAIAKNGQKIAKLESDFYIKVITGAEPLSSYDKFLQQWKAEGGEESIKAANEWYKTAKK